MEKKFNAFDKVIVREDIFPKWTCGFYSHYDFDEEKHVTTVLTKVEDNDILPYEGNEHLVGSQDEPDEEVRLEEGELIVCSDELERLKTGHGVIENFVRTTSNEFHIKQGGYNYNFCLRFSDFNPSNMEKTRKHILCVKNGKIVKYRQS